MPRYVARAPLPEGTVRRPHSRTVLGGVRVPIITPDPEGDEIEGRMRVPLRLTPHGMGRFSIQLQQERKQYIAGQLRRWVEWREHRGWRLNSKPHVSGPYDAPVARDGDERPDWAIYVVRALFVPTEIMTASLEDMLEINQQARRYGVDLWKRKAVESALPRTRGKITSTPQDEPMAAAEKRRQAFGVKRSDYLVVDVVEPIDIKDLA